MKRSGLEHLLSTVVFYEIIQRAALQEVRADDLMGLPALEIHELCCCAINISGASVVNVALSI